MGVSVSVSSGFFGIGEASAGTEYTYSKTKSNSTSYSQSHSITWSGSVEVDPGDYTVVDLLYYTGHFEISYTAEITLIGVSGSEHILTRTGNLTGVASGVGLLRQYHLSPNEVEDVLSRKPREEELGEDKLSPNTEHFVAPAEK